MLQLELLVPKDYMLLGNKNLKNTEKYKLSNIDAADMDIYNNKIYYANKSDGNKIYSICFNGKENIRSRPSEDN